MDVTRSLGVIMQRIPKITLCLLLLVSLSIYSVKQGNNNASPAEQTVQTQPFYSRWFTAVYDSVIAPIRNSVQSFFNNIQYNFFEIKDPAAIEAPQSSVPQIQALPEPKPNLPEQIISQKTPKEGLTQTPLPTSKPVGFQQQPTLDSQPTPLQTEQPDAPLAPEVKKSKFAKLAALKNIIPSFLTAQSPTKDVASLLSFIERLIKNLQLIESPREIADSTAHIKLYLHIAHQTYFPASKKSENTDMHYLQYTELKNAFTNGHQYNIERIIGYLNKKAETLKSSIKNPYNLLGEQIHTAFNLFDECIKAAESIDRIISQETFNTDSSLAKSYLEQTCKGLNAVFNSFPIIFEKPVVSLLTEQITTKFSVLAKKLIFSMVPTMQLRALTQEKQEAKPRNLQSEFFAIVLQQYIYEQFCNNTQPFATLLKHYPDDIEQKELLLSTLEKKEYKFKPIFTATQNIFRRNLDIATYNTSIAPYLIYFYGPIKNISKITDFSRFNKIATYLKLTTIFVQHLQEIARLSTVTWQIIKNEIETIDQDIQDKKTKLMTTGYDLISDTLNKQINLETKLKIVLETNPQLIESWQPIIDLIDEYEHNITVVIHTITGNTILKNNIFRVHTNTVQVITQCISLINQKKQIFNNPSATIIMNNILRYITQMGRRLETLYKNTQLIEPEKLAPLNTILQTTLHAVLRTAKN